ncbi:GAF domain-containing protein [Mucilaginibacter yixingensis]|uniref:GAF domain-containing protein n=1 Tax=Mucilaginibacter yixingensis TaxID=1295612 RepID=UPI0014764E73|nr:GAF domain-containing protein [Mucilaginibacter yixingensis]
MHRFLNLEIDKDAELQEMIELTAELLNCPIALITLIEGDTQYFLYKVGTDVEQVSNSDSFCRYLNLGNDLMVVTDTHKDERFASNPFVTGNPNVVFYAGVPLTTHDGHLLGSICILDVISREFTPVQSRLLRVLAKRVIQIMEFEFSINLLKQQFLQARDAETKLRSFFESSSSCHLLIDRDMGVMAYNKNMASFLKRMYNVMLKQGTHVNQILQGPALESFTTDFKQALSGKTITFEREVNYKNGERIWWYVAFEPGFDAEGKIIGISYNATDITARKVNEEKILAQNSSLRQIAHMQSHELRKPVATILGLMEVLKLDHSPEMTEEMYMLEETTRELDDKIRMIVNMIN